MTYQDNILLQYMKIYKTRLKIFKFLAHLTSFQIISTMLNKMQQMYIYSSAFIH